MAVDVAHVVGTEWADPAEVGPMPFVYVHMLPHASHKQCRVRTQVTLYQLGNFVDIASLMKFPVVLEPVLVLR